MHVAYSATRGRDHLYCIMLHAYTVHAHARMQAPLCEDCVEAQWLTQIATGRRAPSWCIRLYEMLFTV
jgi:hypothetical protein